MLTQRFDDFSLRFRALFAAFGCFVHFLYLFTKLRSVELIEWKTEVTKNMLNDFLEKTNLFLQTTKNEVIKK